MSNQIVYEFVKLVGTAVVAIGGVLYTIYQGALTFFDAQYEDLVNEDQELTEEKVKEQWDITFTHKAVWTCKAFRGHAMNTASRVVLGHRADHSALVVRGRKLRGNGYCYFVAQFGGNGCSTGKSKLDLRIVFSSIKNAALAICKNSTMSRVWVKNLETNPPSDGQVILEEMNGESYLGTY